MDALQHEHADECLERADDFLAEQPDAPQADDGRKRPQEIDRYDAPGRAKQQVGDPPRQRRVLPVAELPLLAQRKVLDEIELEVGAYQHRQRRPHHEVGGQHHCQHLAGLACGECHNFAKTASQPVLAARGKAVRHCDCSGSTDQ